MTRKALGICDKDKLIIPNNWRNRAGLTKESPWGHLWIEWNFHDKTTTFENAANVELQLVTDLVRVALHMEIQNAARPYAAPMVLSSSVPTPCITKRQSVPLSDSWAPEVVKREDVIHSSPSPQVCARKVTPNSNSDDESLVFAFGGVRLRSGTSSTLSGPLSQFGSTNGSLATSEGDILSVCFDAKPKYRHQHSQSFSAATPQKAQGDFKGPVPVRRRGSISIPPTIQSVGGFSDTQNAKPSDSHNVNSLMLQHGIWSTTASDRVSCATSSNDDLAATEGDIFGRGERPSRHTSNPSISSQQRGLTVLSEDEEDMFSKSTSIKS